MGKYKLKLRLIMDDEQKASIIYRAIMPDIRAKQKRSETAVMQKGNNIEIKIDACDAIALRASFNSVARHIALARDIIERFKCSKNFKKEVLG